MMEAWWAIQTYMWPWRVAIAVACGFIYAIVTTIEERRKR